MRTLAPGLVHYLGMVWSLVKLKKPRACKLCKETIACGAMAYRPLTNGYSRMERICQPCVEKVRQAKS